MQYFWEVLAVIMPLVISRSTQYLIILSWNILPYFTFFTSACSWKPRSIERSKNDEMHIQPFLFITFSLLMFSFAPPENIRKLVFWCFQGDQKGTLGRKGLINSFILSYLFLSIFNRSLLLFYVDNKNITYTRSSFVK